jgi:microsomal epoxide hydrolase
MKIAPFRIAVPDADLADLRARLDRFRAPSAIAGAGWAQGMDAAFLHTLATHWRRAFDWRAIEAALNRLPQFTAEGQAGAIHFVHFKGVGRNPVPVVLTHGWPSTFVELLPLGQRLANPAADGLPHEVSFDVVIPSLPGYGFSAPPTTFGTNVQAIADDWVTLMGALGYPEFIAHGGDIGAGVSTALAQRHPERLRGLHLNFIPGSYRPHVPDPAQLAPEEQSYLSQRAAWLEQEGGYSHLQSTKPDTLAAALNDSPLGLAAWIIEKFRAWSDCDGDVLNRFTLDELLTTVSIYWFTGSMPSAMRLYWEGRRKPLQFGPTDRIRTPVAVAHFPREVWLPPRPYVERGYDVVRWTEMPAGGHFAAHEEPELMAADIRAFVAGLPARSVPGITPENR